MSQHHLAIGISPSLQVLLLQQQDKYSPAADTTGKRISLLVPTRRRRRPQQQPILVTSTSKSSERQEAIVADAAAAADDELDLPVFIQLRPITSEQQFDHLLNDPQKQDALLILWMATWCRKCIYLKPKLEKLAVDYYPRIRFYCIDVNAVPHKLVARADVTKMPTVQIWKNSKKQAEVIGGHKAYLVIDEVREMIQNECSP